MSCAGYRANGVNSNQTAAITDRSREKEMNIQEAKEKSVIQSGHIWRRMRLDIMFIRWCGKDRFF